MGKNCYKQDSVSEQKKPYKPRVIYLCENTHKYIICCLVMESWFNTILIKLYRAYLVVFTMSALHTSLTCNKAWKLVSSSLEWLSSSRFRKKLAPYCFSIILSVDALCAFCTKFCILNTDCRRFHVRSRVQSGNTSVKAFCWFRASLCKSATLFAFASWRRTSRWSSLLVSWQPFTRKVS